MKKLLLILTLINSLSILAAAQSTVEEFNKVEIFTGYSAGADLTDDSTPPADKGFNVSAVYNVHKYIGIKADVSGVYRSIKGGYYFPNAPLTEQSWKATHNLYNATVGVQFKDNRSDKLLKPFGHVLVGYANHFDRFKTTCPTGAVCPPFNADLEGVSVIVGGGLDIKLNRRIDIRAFQLDVNSITSKNNGLWLNGRFSAGVIFKF